MNVRRSLLGLTFCTCYLASHLTNKYVLSVLKFTYPTLFQGWQTFIGGLLLHMSWKLGWVELHSSPRSDVLMWLPASALFVGIIYSGSKALSRLWTAGVHEGSNPIDPELQDLHDTEPHRLLRSPSEVPALREEQKPETSHKSNDTL